MRIDMTQHASRLMRHKTVLFNPTWPMQANSPHPVKLAA